jgi:phosphoglycerate dehydrogenase-like enzyme
MGNTGRKVTGIFRRALDSQIIAFNPYIPDKAWDYLPHTRVTRLEHLLSQSDVISLHVTLTPETRGVISYKQPKMMKRSVLVINAARGGVINEQDLCRALDENLIWGVRLDCHEQEPPTRTRYEKLWEHPNVISLPHIGAATSKMQKETIVTAGEKLFAYARQRNDNSCYGIS